MKLFEQQSSAAMNMNIGRAILANIALEALRLEHSLPASIMFVSDVYYVELPPAHIAAAEMAKGR